ncbi:MAG: phytoene desaturase family protein [Acidimicrobiales bacterium]
MTDAVVIGSGPNGLVAANLLADRGWSVTVLEAATEPGGAVRSAELLEPGYVNDLFSAFYPLGKASPIIGGLQLEEYGLRWCRADVPLAHPALDGSCPIIGATPEATAASLEALAPGDGEAWLRLFDRWETVGADLLGTLFRPFPPVRSALGLAWKLKPAEMIRFTRFALLPVRRLGEEEFVGEAARRLLAGNALHADFAPESTLSGFFGWLLASLAQQVGFPVPEGGAGRLSGAMVERLKAKGGDVICDARVENIVVRGGKAVAVQLVGGETISAKRAVIADVDAPTLYLDLVGREHLPAAFLADVDRFHWDAATVKVDWTLDGPIPWSADGARLASVVHVADSVDDLTIGAAQQTAGLLPERPFLLVGQQHLTDPTRQPAGKETAWAYTHVARTVKGDCGGDLTGRWDTREAELFTARMESQIERLAPGFGDLIRKRHIFTPPMLDEANANLSHGAIGGGTSQLHQQLVFRPVPGLGRAETPIKNLFLGSSSAHPGGGVHGACGANAAKAALSSKLKRRVVRPAR